MSNWTTVGKKSGEQKKKKKKVDVKKPEYESSIGAANWRLGGRHFASFRHWGHYVMTHGTLHSNVWDTHMGHS